MSGDPLGNLFAKIRDSVDEPGDEPAHEPAHEAAPEPVPEPAPAHEPAPEPASLAAGGHEAGIEHGAAEDARDDVEFTIIAVDLVDVAPVEPEPHWPVFSVAESATLDDVGLRRRRDVAVGKALDVLGPRVKRLLQDEQNELLDAVRQRKGKGDALAGLPSEHEQVARWAEVLGPAVDDCYAAGRVLGGGRTRPAPDDLVSGLVALLVLPLRGRVMASLAAAVAEGPYDGLPDLQRAIAGAVGARYREWRTQDLEPSMGDVGAWAFARGVYDATPDGVLLRWVPAEVEQCPDADDNALGPTARGCPFPTGQSCPPAHPGCRCLVVPADR